MIPLRYRDRVTGESNTFVARLDGPVLIVVAYVRRTDVAKQITLTLPCWIDERGREKPVYDRSLFALYRKSESAFELPGIPYAPGDREDFWLISIPETIANVWWRAGMTVPCDEPVPESTKSPPCPRCRDVAKVTGPLDEDPGICPLCNGTGAVSASQRRSYDSRREY